MDAMTQMEVFALIGEINDFADRSESLINRTRTSYEQNKRMLISRHNSTLDQLEKSYKSNCEAISSKSSKTIKEARQMLSDVESLDARLTQVDKYYLKTKIKKEAELADTISDQFNEATDYFSVLEEIKSQYTVISRKYSEDILPALINGLNFLFSSKRKKDYEELIVLLNTIKAFVKEIEEELPTITNESLTVQKESYFSKRKELINSNQRDLDRHEQNYCVTLDNVANSMCDELDRLLPDEFVSFLATQLEEYGNSCLKVNASGEIQNQIFYMCYIDYPVDFFVQSGIVASLIKEKCTTILNNDSIRLPVAVTIQDAPTWLVTDNTVDHSMARIFSHAYMFGFLASCPIAKLTFSVVDPENRGNSISPFFDAKKKLPELFGEKIYISREDVSAKINSLNLAVEEVLQEKLGTEFENIYAYAESVPAYEVSPELLVLYDFPKGFDEQNLAGLRNILRNGSRCGIYTLILTAPSNSINGRPDEYAKGLKAIEGLTSDIYYTENCFTMRGMPLLYNPMPEKTEFNKFFGKYMLLFEGIKNRGIAFSPLIKKLVDAQDVSELEKHITYIGSMMDAYEAEYFTVPSVDALFPSNITLGTVLYPVDIFAESVDFDRIQEAFGEKGKIKLFNQVNLPLNLDLNNTFNVLLNSPEKTAEEIRQFTHHIMWSLLSFLPVTKVNFKIVDVENRNSTKPFSDLRKALPELFNVITSQDKVYEMLQEINTQIDDFTQNKLGARYENILEYNQNTPKRSEAITLLLFYDFPRGMDARSVDMLISIIKNGSKCGIYTIICHNPEAQFSRYESIDDRLEQIAKYSISVEYKDGNYQLLPFGLPISISEQKAVKEITELVKQYTEAANVIKHRGISFDDILPEDLFDKKSTRLLDIPIGIGDEDAIINLAFGEGTSHHCLIGGGTGGGKSTLLHTIIMSGMLNYSPEQLHLYLMDFKGGTEFKIYESQRLPHINLIALDAMQEFGESILENLVQEMEERSRIFKEAGGYTKVQDYVEGTGLLMSRILIIMDEFQILFNDSTNRKVAINCANLAKRIVTEGRAYGMHLMMATQSTNIISTLTLDRGTIEQMRVRIGLKCGEADTRYLFSDLYCNDAKTKMMGPKGTAVLNEDYTEIPENNDTSLQLGNIGLRVAYCGDNLKEKYLKLISEKYVEEPCVTQIFEGSRTVALLDYLSEMNIGFTFELSVRVHMGDKIKVAPPFCLSLDRKKKHNMLICGTNQQMTNNVLHNYLISVLLNQNTSVYCIDGDILVGDDQSDEFYQVLKDCTERLHIAESRADIVRFIHDIYEIYQDRKKHNDTGVICVVIKNLQYVDIIKSMFKGERVEEKEYLDTEEIVEEVQPVVEEVPDPMDIFAAFNSVVATRNAKKNTSGTTQKRSADGYSNEKILKIIEDGAGFGIHFVVTSTDYQTVKETMRFGENVLAKFPERVVFSLSNNDADNLVEGVSVASLNNNLVYYTDGVRDTFQLKPYISPKAEELLQFFNNLQ